MPEGTLRPALAKLLISSLELEELWAEEERDRDRRAVRGQWQSKLLVAQLALLTPGTDGPGSGSPREVLLSRLSSYKPVTSMVTLSVTPGGEERPITLLRDTGAAQSLLLGGVGQPSELLWRTSTSLPTGCP